VPKEEEEEGGEEGREEERGGEEEKEEQLIRWSEVSPKGQYEIMIRKVPDVTEIRCAVITTLDVAHLVY
jgi:hypothetical protein